MSRGPQLRSDFLVGSMVHCRRVDPELKRFGENGWELPSQQQASAHVSRSERSTSDAGVSREGSLERFASMSVLRQKA